MPALRLRTFQRRPGLEAYLVVGNSMAPTINDGEIILVDTNDAFNTHRPCAFQGDHGVMVKRRGVVGGRNALISDNPDVEPYFDLADVRALGCAIAVYLGAFRLRHIS
ncbi:S24 family peptidase [Deinococcus sp. UYEF24]